MESKKSERNPRGHRFLWVVFALYLLALVDLIVFKYGSRRTWEILAGWSPEAVQAHLETANYEPFRMIRLYLRHWGRIPRLAFANLVYNVAAFVPFGILVPLLRRGSGYLLITVLSAALFSLFLEGVQLVTLLGEFDVDDLLLNTLGAVLGVMLYWLGRGISRSVK